MSYIDELRERFQAAEERFGRIGEAGKDYRERLMGLMSRIEEEIRCRRDVEQQQAREIERLSGENEELRGMLMSLLKAVEAGDPNYLDDTLGDMDTKVASLIGEGQGAPPAGTAGAEDGNDVGGVAHSAADDRDPFAADEVISSPAGDMPFGDDADDARRGEDALPENAFADEDDPRAFDEDDTGFPAGTEAEADEALTAAPEPAASETVAASEIAGFFGAESEAGEEVVPAYAHPAGEWDDFLNEDMPAAEASDGAATSDDPEAGSIRDLMDRVKSEVGGDAGDPEAEDDNDGGAAAAG